MHYDISPDDKRWLSMLLHVTCGRLDQCTWLHVCPGTWLGDSPHCA